jgi:hypothetical protein
MEIPVSLERAEEVLRKTVRGEEWTRTWTQIRRSIDENSAQRQYESRIYIPYLKDSQETETIQIALIRNGYGTYVYKTESACPGCVLEIQWKTRAGKRPAMKSISGIGDVNPVPVKRVRIAASPSSSSSEEDEDEDDNDDDDFDEDEDEEGEIVDDLGFTVDELDYTSSDPDSVSVSDSKSAEMNGFHEDTWE